MKKLLLIAVLLALAGGIYYFRFYPPVAFKNRAEQALNDFSAAVATKDRAKIGQALEVLLADKAKIRIEISFFRIAEGNSKPVVQEFDKQGFIAFLDNVLYALTDYEYRPRLESFTLSPDRKTAAVTLSSKEWADGISYFGGNSVNMRFSSDDTICDADMSFESRKAELRDVTCKMELRSLPKPGQAGKFNNTDAIRQLLH